MRAPVVIVRLLVVAFAFVVTAGGLKVQPASAGNPEHDKLIEFVNEPCGVIVSVNGAELPADTVAVVGAEDSEKSLALTDWANNEEVLPALLASPPYTAVIECEPTVSELVL